MPKICGPCRHPEAAKISSLILSGTPLRTIADRWSVSKTALIRHRKHIGAEVIRAIEIRKDDAAETLLEKVEKIERNAVRLVEKAEASRDIRGAVVANRALLDVIRLLHEMVPKDEGAPLKVSFDFSNQLRPARRLMPAAAATLPEEAPVVEDEADGSAAPIVAPEPEPPPQRAPIDGNAPRPYDPRIDTGSSGPFNAGPRRWGF